MTVVVEDDKPPPKLRQLYRGNGMEIVTEVGRCRELWREFSPQQTLFDTWEFRFAFFKGYRHTPHFLLIKNGAENLALLPLWYEKDKRKYFWFGSWWQEENRFFAKDPALLPLLLHLCPSPTYLNAVSLKDASFAQDFIKFTPDDPKYILDLTQISSVDDFLANLKKKKRYNLKRDKRVIEAQKPQVIFDNFADFDTLVTLSNERFRQKGETTDWEEDSRRLEAFRQVVALGQKGASYRVRMMTVKIGGQTAGVDLIALFNGCYYPLKCGYDVKSFPGIGSFVNLLEIEDALNLGMEKMDFLEIGYGWKDKWFEEVPLLKYEKNGYKTRRFEKFDKGYFSSDAYDDYLTRFEKEGLDSALKIVEELKPAPAWRFLDVGGGMGGLVLGLRKLGFEAWGTEVSPYCLASSPAKEFLQFGDVCQLPFPDESFEVVVCTDVLCYLTRKQAEKAVKELTRVAKDCLFVETICKNSLNSDQKTNPDPLRRNEYLLEEEEIRKLFADNDAFFSRALSESREEDFNGIFVKSFAGR